MLAPKVKRKIILAFLLLVGLTLSIVAFDHLAFAAQKAKDNALEVNFGDLTGEDSIVPALKIVALLTILSVAPAILLMMTSFTRILIVLGFIRQAIGAQNMPPNQILVGLSLFLTFFTMSPVIEKINQDALAPYMEKTISHEEAFKAAASPIQEFMIKQTRDTDLKLFYEISEQEPPKSSKDVALTMLVPAFMISELKTAFQIGFLIYVPFLVVDMVISSILMAMGMMMLPPTVVSLPFKLVLFILVDGWALIIDSLVKSFQT